MRQNPIVWQFNFFGGLRASNQQRVVERFRTQKTAALLALLALRGGRSREDICTLLWPDAAPEASRNSLSAALSSLRRDLGEGIVIADRTNVSLAPSLYQTDVAVFNDAIKAEDYARAVDIYRGHLLPGFHDDPFPSFEREYEEKARTAFNVRLEELEENGQSIELLELARRAVALFGDEERWFLALMRGHYGLGDLDAALRAYDSLGRFMRKNGDSASESARVLAKLIRRDKEREASTPSAAPLVRKPAESASLEAASRNDSADEVEAPRNNLPTQWTRFFGRENECDMLGVWLRDGQKLVTLSGAGGSGKTRLAFETLRELASDSHWEGDIFFVALAPLSAPDLILPAIRDALQLAGTPDLSPLEQIARFLAGRQALLFLDNFEQLVDGGAARLQSLRERLPQTTFLVTSRVLLQLPGEREFPVAPLPTPLRNTAPALVRECASVALFCDRSGIAVDANNAESVGALCRRLDGIPLALELAAARAKVLSPSQILERLQKHPDFLQSRELGVPARHKTLRATIEWSTDLLPSDLREFWTRLSLFHGGWTLDAAEQIAAPGICEDWETLDWLTLLRECSLIFTEERGNHSRFRMLQTLREFGREQLADAAQVEHAFFDFYLDLAQQAASAMQGPGQTTWLARLDAEQDNLRAALTYARDSEPERGLLLATALIDFWETRLSLDEGRGWIETFLKATATSVATPKASTNRSPVPDSHLDVRARALSGAGRMASHFIELGESRALVEQGLEVARQSGNGSNFVYAVVAFVRFAMTSGDAENDLARARLLSDEAVQCARSLGDKSLLLEALAAFNYVCNSLNDVHDAQGARPTYSEAIELARDLRDEPRLSLALSAFAHVLYLDKKWDEAEALVIECTALARRINLLWQLLEALWIRSNVAREAGRLDIARATITEEWSLCRDNPALLWARSMVMLVVGYLLIREGDPASAVRILASQEALREENDFQLAPVLRIDYKRYCEEARQLLGQERFEALWKEGRSLQHQQVVDAALALGQHSDLGATRARALSGAGRLAWYASDIENAEDLLQQGLRAARQSGDASVLIHATRSSALGSITLNEAARAIELGREGVRLARESGDNELLLKSLTDLGFAEINHLDFAASEVACREAIALARKEGNERILAMALGTLAIALTYLHRYSEAYNLAAESEALARKQGAMWEFLVALSLRAHVSSILGKHDESRIASREALALARNTINGSWSLVNTLLSVAYSFFRRGDARGCVRILGACQAISQSIGYELMPFIIPDYEHFRDASLQALGSTEFAREWEVGMLLDSDAVIDFILEEGDDSAQSENTPLATRARALSGAGRFAWYDSDFEASRELVEQGLEVARQAGDTASFVHAVAAFVRLSSVGGDIEGDMAQGRVLSEEAIRLSRAANDDALLIESLIAFTYAVMITGEMEGLDIALNEAISLSRKSGDELQLATALVSLGTLAYCEKQFERASEIIAESTELCRRLNSPFFLFASLWCASNIAREQKDWAFSASTVIESLELCRDNPALRWNATNSFLTAGYLLVERGDVVDAVQLMGAAIALGEQVGYQLVPLLRADYDRYSSQARKLIGAPAFARIWEKGRGFTYAQALDFTVAHLSELEPPDELLAARAHALSGAGRLAWYASDMQQASALLEQGLDAARQIGDTAGIVYATRGLVRTAAATGDSAKSLHVAREALELARASGDVSLLVKALLDQAFADINVGELDAATALSAEATALSRQIGDDAALSLALNISAIALTYCDRHEEALVLIRESELVARRIGSAWDLLVILALRGQSLSCLGQHALAQESFNECLALCRESFAESWTVANCLAATSYSFMRRGDIRDGAQILGAADAMRQRIGYEWMPVMVPENEHFVALARQSLGEAEFAAACQRGAAMTLDELEAFAIRPVDAAPSPLPAATIPDELAVARSRALSGAGRLAWHDSDLQNSRALVEQGLEAARQSGDLTSFVYAVAAVVRLALVTRDVEGLVAQARRLSEEAVQRSRQANDKALLLDSLISLGYVTSVVGQLPESQQACEEAMALARELGDETNLVRVLTNLGSIHYHLNLPVPARLLLEEGVEICRHLNSPWDLIAVLWVLSSVLRQQGELEASGESLREVFEICRANPNYKWNVGNVLFVAAHLFVEREQPYIAVTLMAASAALNRALDYYPPPVFLPEIERYKARARAQLGDASFAKAWDEGDHMTHEAAIDLALNQLAAPFAATPDAGLASRSRALSAAGRLASQGSDLESSRALVMQGLEAARQSGDLASFVYAVATHVRFSMLTGDTKGIIAQARILSAEAVTRSRRENNKALLLDSLISLSYATCIVGRLSEAYVASEEAIALARDLDDETNLVRALDSQVYVYYHQGIYSPARILLEESEALARRLNSSSDLISTLWALTSVAREQGELDVADKAMRELLEICRANPSFRWGSSNILFTASYLCVKRNDPTKATMLMAAAESFREFLGYQTIPILMNDYKRYNTQLREMLGESAFESAWQQGGFLTPEAALDLALSR